MTWLNTMTTLLALLAACCCVVPCFPVPKLSCTAMHRAVPCCKLCSGAIACYASSSRASYSKRHSFELYCTWLCCHAAYQISSNNTSFRSCNQCSTFVDQLKCLHSIVYLQRHVGWHAWHLLEGVLHSIIDIHNQQHLDLAEDCCLRVITPTLYVSCRSVQNTKVQNSITMLRGSLVVG